MRSTAKPIGKAKDKNVTVRFTPAQHKAIGKLARAEGVYAVGDWIRRLALKQLREAPLPCGHPGDGSECVVACDAEGEAE